MGLARQPGNEVTLSYRRASFGRIKRRNEEHLDAAIAAGELRVLAPSRLVEVHADEVRLEVDDTEQRLANDYVFILAGGIPPYEMMRSMGIRFGDDLA